MFFALIAEVGPARATVITYVNPAVAAILGVAVLNERFTAGIVSRLLDFVGWSEPWDDGRMRDLPAHMLQGGARSTAAGTAGPEEPR